MGRMLKNVIVAVHKDSYSPVVFRNKKGLKDWMKLEGLGYKTFIYEGKKSVDKHQLQDKEMNEYNEWELVMNNHIN